MAEKGGLGITKGPKDLKTPICNSEGQVPPFAPSHVDAYRRWLPTDLDAFFNFCFLVLFNILFKSLFVVFSEPNWFI